MPRACFPSKTSAIAFLDAARLKRLTKKAIATTQIFFKEDEVTDELRALLTEHDGRFLEDLVSQIPAIKTKADLTTIGLWHSRGGSMGVDFLSVRSAIYKIMIQSGGIDALSSEEQQIAIRYFVVPVEIITEMVDEDEYLEMATNYDLMATEARAARYEKGKMFLFKDLNQGDAKTTAAAILTQGLKSAYVDSGIKGSLWGDRVGILDFINATPSTTFQESGLRVQPYEPRVGTLDELCDKIIAIAMEGLQ